MSEITNIEKRNLERLFDMSSGYVLDFSNRTFDEFFMDSIGKSIYDSKYESQGDSKANRFRAFWKKEENHIVGKVLRDILPYAAEKFINPSQEPLLAECNRIAERLSASSPVPELGAISPNSPEKDFATLAKSVKEAIERNEPEAGLDRLHTFIIKYMRVICAKRGINTEREKPLHSLMGEYVKHVKENGEIESEMTERILKSSISALEAFNQVRNNHSFAHDNQVLSYEESILIYNHVTSSIRFIESIEIKKLISKKQNTFEDDLPF